LHLKIAEKKNQAFCDMWNHFFLFESRVLWMGRKLAKQETLIICMYSNHTAVSALFPGLLGERDI